MPVLVGDPDVPTFLKQWQSIRASGKKTKDINNAVADVVRDIGLHPQKLRKELPEVTNETSKRFQNLIKVVTEKDWST